jgi:hypothetical protein
LECDRNQLTSLDVSNNTELEYLECGENQLTSLDVSNNTAVVYLVIVNMSSLHEVCVWTKPFPPSGVDINTTGSPNVYFTTECVYNNDSIVFIPDTAFLYALIDEEVDTNGDSLISYEEAEAIDTLNVSEGGISDMTGIEAFVNLETLICLINQLTSIDISNNTALKHLDCFANSLTSLNVSNNTALTHLGCMRNELARLDVSNCTQLESLNCVGNQLTSLNVSNNTALTELSISDIPTLIEVCVWEMAFPPVGVEVDTTGSPNVEFKDCSSTGNDIYSLSELSIYPNPTNGPLTIESLRSGHHSIELNSLNGQLLLIEEREGTSLQLDLSTFQKGIYFITVRSKDFVTTRKIIKL